MAASLNKRVLLTLVTMVAMLILALSSEGRKIDSSGMLMLALNSEGRKIDSNSIIHRLGYDASKIEEYRRMLEGDLQRLSPGGPDPEHH
ncbi:hypothetical protein SLEP1_g27054 [Rubroshorea leprosula]|uniref:Uncharacterized protein n=1 Tax=Rubroshorea leprosula TaxID=152421 RepID=A0AAV5JS11_9ROSI|nr:hypothetical protein SLEP1_g27054 [Rubroshorea leprosula]